MTDYTHPFEIGPDISHMTNYFDLGVSYPKTAYHPAAGTVDLDDYTQRLTGLPSVVQAWTVLPQVARDALRTYCPNGTAPVVIRTRTNDNSAEFLYYAATMVWPSLSEEYDAKFRTQFNITFRGMVVTSPPS